MDWPYALQVDNIVAVLIVWSFYGLVLGMPIGICAGGYIGLAVWKTAAGGRKTVIGLVLGMILGAAISGPSLLLFSQVYFEHLGSLGALIIIVLNVLYGGATGIHIIHAPLLNSEPALHRAKYAVVTCIIGGVVITAVQYHAISLHIQNSAQLAEAGNTQELIDRVRTSLNVRSHGGKFTGAKDMVALGDTGDPKGVPILAEALRSNDWTATRAAAYALGYLKCTQSADVLLSWLQQRIRTLTSTRDDQCVLVILSLSRLKEKRAVPVLISLLRPMKDENTHTSYSYEWNRLSVSDDLRVAAAKALAELDGRQSISALTAALKDPRLGNDGRGYNVAADILRELSNMHKSSLLRLRIYALSNSPDWGVRMTAAEGFYSHPDQTAVSALIRALDDPSIAVACQAAHALGKAGDKSAIASLKKASRNTNLRLSGASKEALAKLTTR